MSRVKQWPGLSLASWNFTFLTKVAATGDTLQQSLCLEANYLWQLPDLQKIAIISPQATKE